MSYSKCSVCEGRMGSTRLEACTFCESLICDWCIFVQGRISEKIVFESNTEARYVKLAPADHGNCPLSQKNKKILLDAEVGNNICKDVKSIILQYM